jgi:O-antigen/teichoic acid export membrane protein
MVSHFLLSILVARALGPELQGEAAFVNLLAGILPSLAGAGIGQVFLRNLSQFVVLGKHRLALRLMKSFMSAQVLLTVLFATAVVVVVRAQVTPQNQTWTLLGALTLVPGLLMVLPTTAHQALQMYSLNIVPSLLSLGVHFFGTLAVLHWKGGLTGLFGVLLVSRTLDCLLRYVSFVRFGLPEFTGPAAGQPDPDSEYQELRPGLVRFALQAAGLQAIYVVVWDRIEVLFLGNWKAKAETGYYTVPFQLVSMLLRVPEILTGPATVNMLGRIAESPAAAGQMMASILRYGLVVGVPIYFGVAAVAEPAIRLTVGDNYLPAIAPLTIAAALGVIRPLTSPLQQLCVGRDHQGFLIRWMIFVSVLNIGLDAALIWPLGAIGAAVANGVAQGVATVGIWVYACRRLDVPFPLGAYLRVLAAGLGMLACVVPIVRSLPPLAGAALGIPVGAAAYVVLIRWTRSLRPEDEPRFRALAARLPTRLRGVFDLTLKLVIPRPKA